jgi:two-component system sensor histidine kinase UhpB
MTTANRGSLSAARLDALIVAGLSIITALLCARFDVAERLLVWTHPRESYQLDELPVVLLVLATGLVWFAGRRRREARRELKGRRAAELRLAASLADNRRLTQLYLNVQEAERKAIARDLHDELGQYLSALKLDLISIRERPAARDMDIQRPIGAMLANVERMHGAVIGLIRQLRPVGLDELGLAAALEHCVNEWRRRLPQTLIELSADDTLDRLGEPCRVAFYRIIQEAMTNIARHSHARHVAICIGQEAAAAGEPGRVRVEVKDDGVGAEPGVNNGGLGLVGMRERVQALGGELSVRSEPQSGFTILARIPLLGAAP